VEHRLRVRTAPDHVHVDRGHNTPREFRLRIQQGDSALDFRWPDEPDRSSWPRQLPVIDQLLQRPGHLEYGDATTGIVVGPRPLMVQVTRKRELAFLQCRIR